MMGKRACGDLALNINVRHLTRSCHRYSEKHRAFVTLITGWNLSLLYGKIARLNVRLPSFGSDLLIPTLVP
jgi:hypothetical protein